MNERKSESSINPAIELLRGVAALMVVYAHYWKVAGIEAHLSGFSYTGVDLFFVLSGFVFAPYFFGQSLQVIPFFIRRLFRIYPLYFVGVVLYWLLRQGLAAGAWSLLIKHLLFLHTWQSYEIAYALNPAFWSLPPEVEFYLLLPLLARFVQGPRAVVALFVAAVALRFGLDWLSPPVQGIVNEPLILGFHLPGLLSEFLCGVVAWRIAQSPVRMLVRAAMPAAGMLGLLVLAWIATTNGDAALTANAWSRGNMGLLAALCYALLVVGISSLRFDRSVLPAVCSVAGALSYGLYIFHNAARNLAVQWWGNGATTALLALVMSVMMAAAGHWLIERPLRQWGRAWSARLRNH